jgi:hypothetical protein
MNLNKLKLYIPTSSGGGAILDQPYSDQWSGDTSKGRSANSLYNLIESIGKLSKIIVVDAVYGNDYSATAPMRAGQRENILRPFKDINVAIYFMQPGDVMVVMPGIYNITNFPGLVPRNDNTFILVNATLTYSGQYSPFFNYPTPATGVKVIGIGSSSVVKSVRNGWGGVITPYTGVSQTEFYNLTLSAPEQAVAGLGAAGANGRIVDFYNCSIYQMDSQVVTAAGGGSGGTSTYLENCYIKGYTYLASGPTATRPQYNLKAVDCYFEAIDTNYNGKVNCIDFGEYYGDSSRCNLIFQRCSFKSDHHVIETGLGYGGLGTNKRMTFYDCKFMTGIEGWIVNNHNAFEFMLLNNYTNNPATGSDGVVNLLSTPGVVVEPNFEIYPY